MGRKAALKSIELLPEAKAALVDGLKVAGLGSGLGLGLGSGLGLG